LSKNDILNEVEKNVQEYMENKHYSCAMASLTVLQEQFGIDDHTTIKATSFLPGIASRGETCGAVLGSLMAIGMLCATDDMDNMEERRKIQDKTADKFCEWFVNEFNGLTCRDVQTKLCGRSFNMRDEKEREKFRESAAGTGCRSATAKAARIAAEIIMENKK
jgi:C_GCAxxG_C_C family probable redox protein